MDESERAEQSKGRGGTRAHVIFVEREATVQCNLAHLLVEEVAAGKVQQSAVVVLVGDHAQIDSSMQVLLLLLPLLVLRFLFLVPCFGLALLLRLRLFVVGVRLQGISVREGERKG